jgi:hypothetical protein
MGNKHSRNHSNSMKRNNTEVSFNKSHQIKGKTICPLCHAVFDSSNTIQQVNDHLIICGKNYIRENQVCEIYSPNEDQELIQLVYKYNKEYKISPLTLQQKSGTELNTKLEELKKCIKSRKISWEDGCCNLEVNRNDLLSDSMKNIEKVDLFKELKINFLGEICYDAGGIFREWFTTIFKALESEKLKLFIVSETQEFSYIINPFLKHNQENFKYFSFIGKLLGKALLDNITINVCFNKLIYKMILQEDITYDDLIFIDKELYKSLKNLKDLVTTSYSDDIYDGLYIYYSVDIKDTNNKMHNLDLVENGSEKPVKNINDYINKRISLMKGLYEPFIQKIRESLFNLIPKDVIQKFTSDELELLINGRPFIDLEDWRQNTIYKTPYNNNHKLMLWFWDILESLSQKELSNLLMFSTGTSRVPFGGFSCLESNRGNISKFTIEYVPYTKGKNKFIKAHTCFNRLDIPNYDTKEELKEAIKYISSNEIIGFGID